MQLNMYNAAFETFHRHEQYFHLKKCRICQMSSPSHIKLRKSVGDDVTELTGLNFKSVNAAIQIHIAYSLYPYRLKVLIYFHLIHILS